MGREFLAFLFCLASLAFFGVAAVRPEWIQAAVDYFAGEGPGDDDAAGGSAQT